MVRKGGTVNFFGGCAGGHAGRLSTPIAFTTATSRCAPPSITLRPSAVGRLHLIAGGKFQASAFITGHAHLYELNRVFEKLMNRSSEIKTAIVP